MPGNRRVVAIGLSIVLAAVVFDRHYRFFDMAIYSGAVRWWLSGGDLYAYQAPVQGLLGFTYPPFAALVLMPAAVVPVPVAGWLTVLLGLAALAAGLRTLHPGMWPLLLLAAAVATEPVRQTLGLGQVNLLLFGLIVLDLGRTRTGVGVGLATAIKLTPGLFIVYLLVTRQWRAAGVAAGTFGAVTGAGCLIAPRETMRYFGDLLWETGRVGAADAVANQSLAGLLARTSVPDAWWMVLCAVAVLVGLGRAVRAHGYGQEAAALALVGLTANLITPVAWSHHLVFLPVALIVLARSGRRHLVVAAAGLYVLSVLSPIWWHEPGFLAANTFVLMAIALICTLPTRPPHERAPGGLRRGQLRGAGSEW